MSQTPPPLNPDPNGPPAPRKRTLSGASEAAAESGLILLWCGLGLGVVAIVAMSSRPTMGALRSRRLVYEQRQQEIAAAATELPAPERQP